MENLKLSTITLAAVMLSSTIIMSVSNANGQTPASSWTPPTNGTFVCWNLADTDCWWMLPYPGPTCDDCGVYYLGTTNGVSWYGFYDSNCLARADQGLANGSFSANEAEGGSDGPMGPQYGTNDLWLEITRVRMAAGLADLLLHGTSPGGIYQLESTTDLRQPPLEWSLGPIKFGDDNTNVTAFSDFPICGNLQMFFRAHHAEVRLRIEPIQDAIEPIFGTNWQNGSFAVTAVGVTQDLIVQYRISGLASNGADYTSIPGVVTIPASAGSASIDIEPIEHYDLDFDEDVTLTLVHSNAYVIEMAQASATITNHDNLGTNIFVPIKPSSFGDVTGLDYHSPTRSLIAGLSSAGSGSGNFLSIDTNSAVTSWSGVNQSVGELKFAIVKQSANGFTNGAIYFNSESNSAFPGVIGRVSSNGSAWSTNWATLTNEPLLLQGGFYVDQTGVFSNNLIVVSGVDTNDGARIWQVDAAGNATNLAFLPLVHCEGVITLSNDVARWGPWAGKILTGAENTAGCPSADLIFAINTNGAVASFDLGISAEHFDLIPADQDLYLSLEGAADSIVKLPRTLLSQYVGDLLITQGGRYGGLAHSPGFFIVRWDGSRFTKRGIDLQFYSKGAYNIRGSGEIEGVSFAPIDSAP